ncbi:S9 family peptidase [Flagellimonas meridianipacifica]|uniref:Dipeptidyl aminopeptidase/acylaminoacyl peptidase n=1 Tax=Flagellimonas meridianipacifica TaxID=1080225 RepID=A0A2T0MCD0_9FLAO|nr:S9 family peptidase [Allomuricauda pacifica]PRX55151.1 dipeptidyl aminopeptidase/acylaminoacyl peptidase [Allomuricauda pacifica]
MKNTLIILFSLILVPSFGQEKTRLSLDHYENYEWTSNPTLSPDGKQILYSRTWINLVDDTRETDLWIMNSNGSTNRFFLNGSNGKWSPDGTKIAFTKKGEPSGTQIFVKYLGVEGEPTQITKLEKSPSSMEWSPDSKHIAFIMHVDSEPALKPQGVPSPPKGASWTKSPQVVDQVDYTQDRVGFLERGFRQLFIVPADGGTARQITIGEYDDVSRGITWTKDSKSIIFSSYQKPEAEYARGHSNLYAVNINSLEVKEITSRDGAESSPRVSPDGSKIAFIGSTWSKNFYHDRKMYIMDSDGSNMKCITTSLDQTPSAPIWDAKSSGVYFNVREYGQSNVYYVDTKGKVKKITNGNHMLTMNDLAGSLAVATWSDPSNPSDIVTFPIEKAKDIQRLTNVNDDIFYNVEFGQVEEIKYNSVDGKEVQGWIVKPPRFDANKKYPLVLRIHGGPHGMYHVGFNYNFQLHAAQDQVVLYTNPRGSTGYGYDFANAIQNAYPGNDYDDIMAGVDEVIAKGYIDENKMYVYGGSGGGVLTSWIVGQTDRFAAASVNYPVTNWFSFVGTTDGAGWYYNFEKYPWEDPSEHIKRSPLMYVGNVKTPTMLMCGEEDLRTPISQTEEYYQALKMNKVPTVMVRFNKEYHGTSSKPSNFLRTHGYINAWFDRHAVKKKSMEEIKTK